MDKSLVIKNCDKARELMQRSRSEHFAVGAFNIDNQETLIAVCRAAQKLNSPVLVEISKTEVDFMGLTNVRSLVDNYKKEYGIEIYANLDHSPSVEDAKEGIDAGFEFIHIDISQSNHEASDEEIISATKETVEYAKTTGALVESEPHYFCGSSNLHEEDYDYEEIKKTFTTPEGAKEFVKETGIDTFAAAVGNLHGKYPIPKKLDLELLKNIRDTIDCNISLHGGSGTPLHYFEEAAKIGVSKININSDLRIVYRNTLEKELNEKPNEYAILKLIDPVIEEVQKVVEAKMHSFQSPGKAIL
jgi:fructose-bisphosphate aldolase, class II